MGKMKAKYIEETFKKWMIFGEHPETKLVDISDGDRDVLTGIRREEAEKIIKDRDMVIDVIIELIGDDYEKLTELRKRYELT